MHSRIEKLNAIAETKKVDTFLITSAASVKYLSGYFFYFEYGSSPFHFLPAALFVMSGKNGSLVIADNELHQSANIHAGISIKPYSSYVHEKALEFTEKFLIHLHELFEENNLHIAR